MLTKETLKRAISRLCDYTVISDKLYGLGIDVANSDMSNIPFDIFNEMIRSHFSEECSGIIMDWVYDRVFDVTGRYKDKDKFNTKSPFITSNIESEGEPHVVVDDFDSLCAYFGIN